MQVDAKLLGKLVRIVDSDYINQFEDIRRSVWAIPSWVDDWQSYLSFDEYYHCRDYANLPVGLMGTVLKQCKLTEHVTANYALVMFPKSSFPGNDWLLSQENPAGWFWISGEFLELVPEEEFDPT